ncbi:MAG: T9SS type A sorting domain-containing protein [Chitinophagales bacterium]
MKLIFTILLLILSGISYLSAQSPKLYGFTYEGVNDSSGNWLYNSGTFVSLDYLTGVLDTGYAFHGSFGVQNNLNAIDPFNKRYFFAGWADSLPGIHLFTINIANGSYTAMPFEVGCANLEYDPFNNRMLYVLNNQLKAFDLATGSISLMADISGTNSMLGGSNRIYNYMNGNFSFISGDPSIPFLYWVTADTAGIIIDTTHIPNYDPDWSDVPIISVPTDLSFDPNSNIYYGWRCIHPGAEDVRGEIVQFDPISGEVDSLGFFYEQNRLNSQFGNMDLQNKKFLIPNYDLTTSTDHLVLFDMVNNSIDTILPYCEVINFEKFEGYSFALLKKGNNKLIANYGTDYQWFLNDVLVPAGNHQTLENASPGFYKVAVTFMDGTIDTSAETYFVGNTHVPVADDALEILSCPNPFTSFTNLTLQSKTPGVFSIQLYNAAGILCRQFQVRNKETYQMLRENLPAGIYSLHLTKNKNLAGVWKLIML